MNLNLFFLANVTRQFSAKESDEEYSSELRLTDFVAARVIRNIRILL